MSTIYTNIYRGGFKNPSKNLEERKQIRKDMFAIRKLYKESSSIPEDTGALKNHMTQFLSTSNGFKIVVSKNNFIKRTKESSKYYGYFLETGTGPHDIPNSFGRGKDYGFGKNVGRDYWHPGSNKWKGWFSVNLPALIIKYFDQPTITNNKKISNILNKDKEEGLLKFGA